jgi:hypothetical protein
MRLTWRDALTTLLAGAVVVLTLAVTQGWGWPLLGGYGAGTVALAIAGLTMCAVGGSSARTPSAGTAFVVIASVLGVAALGLVIASLIVQSQTLFITLAASILLLWALTTARHAFEGFDVTPMRLGSRVP